MLAYPLYAIRYVFWWIGNLLRRFRKGPDYLVLTLSGDYDQIPAPPTNPLIRYFRPPRISLFELGRQFQRVADDPKVKGIILHLRSLEMPPAKLDTLRGYIQELRAAGKRVVSYSQRYDLASYYLACLADEVLLQPGGEISPLGISREYVFLAEALAQVGVQGDFVQISPYKSAGDRFVRREMSQEVREMGSWLADAAWDEFVTAVVVGRNLDTGVVRAMLDQTPCTDLQARELDLVDALLSEEDLPQHLGEEHKPVTLTPWFEAISRLRSRPPRRPGKYVALMSVEGMIIDGTSQQPPMEPPFPVPLVLDPRAGDISVVGIARRLVSDKRAAAVVLFVDSRGGSATASESMAAALKKVAQKKPLVVVMGGVAASGGYYVSTPGAVIFAQPNTITGSIGVLTGKFADTGLLQKLFVHRQLITRGEAALFYDPGQPWSESERAKVWNGIQRIYQLFLERVSASREMEPEAVDAIAGGRVWTGRQALENGLVDKLGGLDQALAEARQLAGLREDASVRLYFPAKQAVAPVATPASILKYAIDGVGLLSNRTMCLCPWVGKTRN
jgi:protease-4